MPAVERRSRHRYKTCRVPRAHDAFATASLPKLALPPEAPTGIIVPIRMLEKLALPPTRERALGQDPSAVEGILSRHRLRDQGSHGPLRPRIPRQRDGPLRKVARSEEHTSELQSLMRISYAVFCLKKKTNQ